MLNRHGIPVEVQKSRNSKKHQEFMKYRVFVTLIGFENGRRVISTCPMAHEDFRKFKQCGFKVIDKWTR